ncbi:MAG: hypothetical protein GY856_02860 [bacterium]|nr:hypothetical protein [bacterium]
MSFNLRRLLPADLAADPSRRAGFWYYAAHLLTNWGIALSNLFLGLMMLWCILRRRELGWDWPRTAPIYLPLGFYLIFLTVSVVFSLDPLASTEAHREFLSLATLALGIVLVRGERDVRRIFDLLIALIALLAVHGIAQYYFTDYGTLDNRIVGAFSHYQTFAGVLLIGDLLLLARIVSGQGWKRPWHWAALVVINWTLLLTLTRGAWVAAAITFTAYVLVRARRFFVVYVAAALLVVLLVPDSWGRIRSIVDLRNESNYDRLCMVEAGLYMISERPLLGLGPGMVRSRYPIYRNPTAPRFTVPHLHNAYLELAAERGLLSLAAYLWLMGAGLWLAYRAYRREGGPRGSRADLYVGVILALVGFNIAGVFEDNWQDTEVQRLILFLLATPLCLETDTVDEPERST